MPGPIFISIEGGEGAGKSTQVDALHQRLWNAGIKANKVHEPGSTPLGWYLRDYLMSKRPLSKEAELLLFEAARTELVINEIKPQLAGGFTIIADRFEASTVAYQGYGRRIDLDVINRLNSFATQGVFPDLSFLLDLDPAEGLRRVGHPQLTLPLEPDENRQPGRQDIEGQRRFEDQPLQFHTRVRKGFLDVATESPERWVVVDASRSAEEISEEIWRHVVERLEIPGSR